MFMGIIAVLIASLVLRPSLTCFPDTTSNVPEIFKEKLTHLSIRYVPSGEVRYISLDAWYIRTIGYFQTGQYASDLTFAFENNRLGDADNYVDLVFDLNRDKRRSVTYVGDAVSGEWWLFVIGTGGAQYEILYDGQVLAKYTGEQVNEPFVSTVWHGTVQKLVLP